MTQDVQTHRIYTPGGAVLRTGRLWLSTAFLILMLGSGTGYAQTNGGTHSAESFIEWELVVNGVPAPWPAAQPTAPLDSLHMVARRVLTQFQHDGYYRAQIDSAVVDSAGTPPRVRLYVRRGPRIEVGRIRIEGEEQFSEATLRRLMDTEAGEALNPERLEADLEALVTHYEEAGYPLAQVQVEDVTLVDGVPPQLELVIQIEERRKLWLKRIEVDSSTRSSPRYLAQAAGLEPGAVMRGYDPEAIQQRLEKTGLFREVGLPELRITAEGGAIMHLPLKEKAPGTFDLVLGYLPPDVKGGSGHLVGNGHLTLENLFGGGRTMGLRLDRRPGQVSRVHVRIADPYFIGWPLRIEGRFTGEQRDSTYGKQAYRLATGYQFEGGLEVFGTLTREVTRPGQAGARLRDGAQRIPRAEAWFAGLGIRYQRVDHPVNPRRGVSLETNLERGRKARTTRTVTAEGDTTLRRQSLKQERLNTEGRLFIPTLSRQVLALGADAQMLLSDEYDRSDLFHVGGANSLRGYDEDRFIGHIVGRVFLEYRYQIDRQSYAFVFSDLGYVRTPRLADLKAVQALHPGYGIGMQFYTNFGLINASYALSTEDESPANGRIHIGLSVGL